MTVTASFTLTSDESCSGTAIFIEKASVTVNLGGHTLTGDGSTGYGVEADFSSDVVQNGVINSFDWGVTMYGTGDKATNLQTNGNVGGGIFTEGNTDVVSGNYVIGSPTAIWIDGGDGPQVTNNTVESNSDYGIYTNDATRLIVSGNKALNTGGTGDGIVAADDTGKVTGNVANGNVGEGFFLDNPGTGPVPAVTASGNRAAFNGDYGILAEAGGVVDGGTNVVQDNATAAQCFDIVCHEVDN